MYEIHLWPTVYVYELVLQANCVLSVWGHRKAQVFAQWLPAQLLCVAVICKSVDVDAGGDPVPYLWNAP